ncbi:AlpA family transcriptional regulator [Pseudomonas sp. JUb52]|nr:AlpA family phage regulatory protein [Pseudomonas sp. JUb52]TCQ87839.1 AlpA family transcriptional regulator [Pseudomonas sp. JUb52]
MATAEPRRFIRRHQVEALTSLSRTQIYRLIARNEFPRQVKLAPGHAVWVEQEVAAWVDQRIAAARGEAA